MNKLYIFCGIPFAGKSELAKKIVNHFGFTRIDLDEIKSELFGKGIEDESIDQNSWDQIYQEMYKQIETTLAQEKTVVHDTGNFTLYERNLVRQIGEKFGIETITIFVNTPVKKAKQRLQENRKTHSRFDVSDVAFESAISEMEPPQKNEKHIIYNGSTDVNTWITKNFQ